jgi:hypothetical protein
MMPAKALGPVDDSVPSCAEGRCLGGGLPVGSVDGAFDAVDDGIHGRLRPLPIPVRTWPQADAAVQDAALLLHVPQPARRVG